MNQQNYQLPQQNNVVLVGRLTRDPETRRTSTSKTVCKFDIAIGRRFKDAATGEWKDADPTFVPIVVWGDQANRCGDRLRKGMPVHVEGRLQTNSWQATDGTKKSRIEVIASRVQILVRSDQAPAAKTKVEDADNEYVSENDVNMGDEEVPF
ncbi:MAG: single-stranded DNA-binding protein [Endomicrobiaceae bacterium]|jgi:single-strand DNA-binding protein|nr:single-stranded DNA-binding protein [Endomicrobiaceae bacterium]MDD3729696.1 single-stranded DNA-binding protein [Endomicrobiaceae bacterium]MDD4165782.1 single-stranded DNA-binding protein [Endomicrobiaceae bacterium]